MASVEFSGMIREEPSAGPSPFREVWNMTKPGTGNTGWLVAGASAAVNAAHGAPAGPGHSSSGNNRGLWQHTSPFPLLDGLFEAWPLARSPRNGWSTKCSNAWCCFSTMC